MHNHSLVLSQDNKFNLFNLVIHSHIIFMNFLSSSPNVLFLFLLFLLLEQDHHVTGIEADFFVSVKWSLF